MGIMIKCSPAAFAKCPYHDVCGSIFDAEFFPTSDCEKFNQEVMNLPQTNADRIRAMSDEELAKWMSECNAYKEYADASQWLLWLQQPAEENQS